MLPDCSLLPSLPSHPSHALPPHLVHEALCGGQHCRLIAALVQEELVLGPQPELRHLLVQRVDLWERGVEGGSVGLVHRSRDLSESFHTHTHTLYGLVGATPFTIHDILLLSITTHVTLMLIVHTCASRSLRNRATSASRWLSQSHWASRIAV